jgi:hypothetical protein
MGAGDWEEHAVMLCNHLLWLEQHSAGVSSHADDVPGGSRRGAVNLVHESQWSSYLVLGRAVPEGPTVWVLRLHRTQEHAILINACTVRCRVVLSLSLSLT